MRRNRNESVFARLMDLEKTLQLRFRVRHLELPEKKKRYTYQKSDEEGVDARMCLCGNATGSRSRIAGECERKKEERDGIEKEMGEIIK